MFCFNVLDATKDSRVNEQKLNGLVSAVEDQMKTDGTSLATNRIYEANSIDANELKGMLNNVAPIERIFSHNGKNTRELTEGEKYFQKTLAKDLEDKVEGVDIQRLSKDLGEIEHEDLDMSLEN